MRVLVTGNKGFIGSRFMEKSKELFKNDVVETVDLKEGRDFVDIKNKTYDLVIHFAATVSVTESMRDPVGVMTNNCTKLIDFLNNNKVEKIVFMSTVAVYPEEENINESMAGWKNCKSVYALSKWEAENVIDHHYWDEGIDDVQTDSLKLRLSNVVGKGGKRDNLSVIEHFEQDNPIVVYGGNQSRDFIDVDVVCNAIINGIKKNKTGTYTIASGKTVNIGDLAKDYASRRGVPLQIVGERGGEIERQSFNIDRAKKARLI